MDVVRAEKLIKELLECFEVPLPDEVKTNTPRRIAEMYEELLSGYTADSEMDVQFTQIGDLVILTTDFISLCEHHLLPFYGDCYIGYVPDAKIVGASKLARLVEKYSRRLQLQERMTNEMAQEIMDKLKPKGCMVVTVAEHFCMKMRGVKKPAKMICSAIRGLFEKPELRNEFLSLIR